MMFIVGVTLVIELYERVISGKQPKPSRRVTHKLEDSDFHHALVEVSRLVLYNLNRHHLVSLHVLAFDDLTEGSLAKNVQNKVPIQS